MTDFTSDLISTQMVTPYRRFTPRVVAPHAKPEATRVQRALEYGLFAVFGGALLVAAIAMFVVNSSSHRAVPNLVGAGITADRVNVLVITTARDAAEALMLVSVKPSTNEVAVISVPNDLWVPLGRYGQRRLGSGFKVGNMSGYPGGGPALVGETLSSVLGQPVHGFVRLQTSDLKRAVDAIGGIEIDVHRGAYEARTRERFTRGRHRFDGERAFRYALSRRMVGPANDRFEREARQRAVIVGLLAKLPATKLDSLPMRDERITNLTREQLSWMRHTLTGTKPRTLTLAPYVDVIQVATIVDQGEVLRPREDGFRELRDAVADVFATALPQMPGSSL